MKRSMLSYVKHLSQNSAELEDIILNKYRKFIKFYWMVCEYSNVIEKLQYETSDNDTLCVTVTIKNKQSLKELLNKLCKSQTDNLIVESNSDKIHITIIQDEELQP